MRIPPLWSLRTTSGRNDRRLGGPISINRREGHSPKSISLMAKVRRLVKLSDALGTSNEVVDGRTNPMSEDDDQDPDQLVVAVGWFFRGALNEHEDPEDSAHQAQYHECQEEER